MSTISPNQILDELDRLETLRDPSPETLGQRAFERSAIRGEADLHPLDRGCLDRRPILIHLRDISLGGFGFVCTEALPVGSAWQAQFLHEGYPSVEQTVLIRHCQRVEAGVYLCGSQFVASPALLKILGVKDEYVRTAYSTLEQIED